MVDYIILILVYLLKLKKKSLSKQVGALYTGTVVVGQADKHPMHWHSGHWLCRQLPCAVVQGLLAMPVDALCEGAMATSHAGRQPYAVL